MIHHLPKLQHTFRHKIITRGPLHFPSHRLPPKLNHLYDIFTSQLHDDSEEQSAPNDSDPIFLAVDISVCESTKTVIEIGAAYMDSRYLRDDIDVHCHHLIQSHNYVIGLPIKSGLPESKLQSAICMWKRKQRRAASQFDYNARAVVPYNRLYQLLQRIFCHEYGTEQTHACCRSKHFKILRLDNERNTLTPPAETWRPLVIVGHGIRSDMDILRRLGFALQAPVQYVDTMEIAKALRHFLRQREPKHGHSLRELCYGLGFRPTGWHVSGRDALFSMVALMKMAATMFEKDQSSKGRQTASKLLHAIKNTDPLVHWEASRKAP
ncbi:hypothetical protein BU24DRAFT_423731 [Aaosphaeria arxii CBS 175.79]|uniref:Gfd2/YDR514C-like C-terminal domain-containing protein n=1 Tax=Aaosphaeria arxii CBS 175.79 TaxID=1450172 RepID=A0A6A5XPI1_9PLEO|nr:uncharacterized protein BU24DRAFT_423731 [Aaosphaeria arxii CBS 175.79]KAF2014816.1 hypothetical protein BU24DRAFT_423731 [Aaosphaeria arxii CBS 175.79]